MDAHPEPQRPNAGSARSPERVTQLLSPVNLFLSLLGIAALSICYYFAIALPNHNQALLELEREKFKASQQDKQNTAREKQLREEQAKNDAMYREVQLTICASDAESNYWNYVKLNGKAVPGKNGVYTASSYIWDIAEQRKRAALDECHRQWDSK